MHKQKIMVCFLTYVVLLVFGIAPLSAYLAATANTMPLSSPRAELEDAHLMPPHPTIMEQVRQGNLTLPDYLLNPDKAEQLGINQPNLKMNTGPTGTWKTIALLVDFSDKTKTVTASFFDSLLFGTSFKQLNHYYKAVSYGQLDIVSVTLPSSIGWKRMPQTYSYYVYNNYCIYASYPHNCQKLAEDAVAAANSVVDFSKYDNDGDGYVDTVFIIHAGRGAEITSNTSDIWSHSWSTYNEPYVDGVRVSSYTTEPEYWTTVSASTSDMTIGVYAHELGHAFGLPDLYDYDDSSQGIGDWSLMAGGSWNGTNGDSPSFLDAWSRVQLGWVTPINVSGLLAGANIRNAETYQDVYKLKSSVLGTNEYFLVENRQKTGYDAALPGAGLLIWHIDEAKINLQQPNNVECENFNNWLCGTNHPLVALEQADGSMDLEKNYDQGDTGDPYPTAANTKRTFNNSSTPNTSSYYYTVSADTKLYVINISNSASTMTADLYVAAAPGAFNKTNPTNTVEGISTSPTLSWETSLGTVSYEYCIDTNAGNTCDASWVSTGSEKSKVISGLSASTTYYWQVRAKVDTYYTYANSNTWWQFKTVGTTLPSAFNKLAPPNNSTNLIPNQAISWEAISDTTSYEYCIDTINDNACTLPAIWKDVGNTTSATPSGQIFNTSFYWQVRAKNALGTTEASDGWWKFTTMAGQSVHLPLVLKSSTSSSSTLVNGDFEQGSGVGWQEYSLNGLEVIMSNDLPIGIPPHGGNWATWLGGYNDEISYISQLVTVSPTNSYLHLWYWVASADICNYDYGHVRINGSNIHTWNLCSTYNTGGWVELDLNLSAYAGQTVTLEVRAQTDSSENSNLFIDDVSFTASAAPPVSAPTAYPLKDPTSALLPKPEGINKR